MELMTKCYSCGGEIIFADGRNLVQCEYCGRTNERPKSQPDELELMKYSNERLSFGEFNEAEKGYRKVLQRTPDEHEARWGLLLCKYGVRYVEDTRTGQRLPTCRRALPTSFCAEPDFKLACEAAPAEVREEYERDGRYIDDIQKEIRRLKAIGERYDIFLCYKETDETGRRTRDSMLAQNLYQTLTLHGFSAFFAPLSLKKRLGANYEAAIYVALEASKVMLVMATKPEYLETTWVKSEWTRYFERMDEGEEKLLIPLYRDFPPDRLPREFNDRFLQGLDMGNFTFIPDLEAFLASLLKTPEPSESPESPKPQEVSQLEMRVRRGFRELKDGDFDAAGLCFERALDEDYEHPRANLGMAMVGLKVRSEAELEAYCVINDGWETNKYIKRAGEYGNDEMKALFARIREARRVMEEKERARQEAEERDRREAEEQFKKDFDYESGEQGIVVKKYRGASEEVVIPASIDGRTVVEIGESAFEDCDSLIVVKLPEGVVKIGESAFMDCGSLTRIDLPEGVTEIGVCAFSGCNSLTDIVIPKGVTMIDECMFYGCGDLTGIVIPEGVTRIGAGAFRGCGSLAEIVIPEGVTQIGYGAFQDCISLTGATIPRSMDIIWASVFEGCKSLKHMTIPENVRRIGWDWDAEKGYVSLSDVVIPEGVTEIGAGAFLGCGSLTGVVLPESVTEIGEFAFSVCGSLTGVTIPDGVAEIGKGVFDGCDKIRIRVDSNSPVAPKLKAAYGDRIEYIDSHIHDYKWRKVDGNVEITGYKGSDVDIVIPSKIYGRQVVGIAERAFADCGDLRGVVIPKGVTKIGVWAFSGCGSLMSVTIPSSVTEIGFYAFASCGNVSIKVGPGSPIVETLKKQYGSKVEVVAGLRWPEDSPVIYTAGDYEWRIVGGNVEITGYKGSDAEIVIPSQIKGRKVTGIAERAFADCGALMSVRIPKGVTKIGMWAFSGCSSLMSVMIPDSVTEIGFYAFASCKDVRIKVGFGSPIAGKLKAQYGSKVDVVAGLR